MEQEGARPERQRKAGLRVKLPIVLAITAGLFLAASCTKDRQALTIFYEQKGACNTGLGANQAYYAFQVYRIENLGKTSKDFPFDPAKLYIDDGSGQKKFLNPSLQIGQPKPLTAVTVKKSTVALPEGTAVILLPTFNADGARDGATTAYKLDYDTKTVSGRDFSVVSRDETKISFDYTPDCTKINYGTFG